jgi:hypothetical protein
VNNTKIAFYITVFIYTFFANVSWAEEVNPNKKLLKPMVTPAAIKPIAASDNHAGADVSLNPQPFPPVEAAKLPTSNIKPVSIFPTPAANQDGAVSSSRPLPPTGTPIATPLGGDLVGSRLDACQGKPCIVSVNGHNVGSTHFKPGTRYQLIGKKFGHVRGDVVLNIDGDTAVKLDVTAWHDEEIIAYFKNDFSGKQDSDNVALFIDVPNTPRITTINNQRGQFEALKAQQIIKFTQIPQSAITYEQSGEFGGPNLSDRNGYWFRVFFSQNFQQSRVDSVKHQFTDTINLGFLNSNFKVTDVHAEFTRTDTNGSRCDRCGSGSGGTYVYGDNGWELQPGKLVLKRAVWQNHISPTLSKAGENQFYSWVQPLELVVEGPKGVNPIK